MHTTYTGELVKLRPFRNLEEWLAIQSVPELNMSPFWGPWHCSEPERKKEFEKCGMLSTDDESCFAIERLDTGECIGIEECGPVRPGILSTWLGTVIDKRHWSRGFGREAKLLVLCYLFENFPLHSVWADTTAEHLRAQAGLVACGLKPVGGHQATHWRSGRSVDVPLYQIMREDWEVLPIRQIVKRG